jgi:hypothetical protein
VKGRNRREDLNLFQRGPVRAIRDHRAKDIRIETTKDNEEGEGIVICRLPMNRMREAQAIVALSDLIKAGGPFAALGIMVMEADGEDPLIYHEEDVHVSVGDAHRMMDAMERACIAPEDRIAKPWHKDRGPKLRP